MLHDFAAAMLALEPAPGDLILDLGAGACWCSDLLGRLNRPTIAVDISFDMLRAGRSRTGANVRAATGDLEALPFRSGVFQKAVCLDAVHHVPDIAGALREVSRVLDRDGVALFSEPGRGHAGAPVAAAAVRDFGVLEQEILIGPFIRQCREAGFEHVTVKPLLQSVPDFELTLDEWDSWSKLAASTRPRRAVAKIWFALAELFGFGKRGPLFEEAMAVHMVRTVRQVVEHHPVIVAAKTRKPQHADQEWRASIRISPVEPIHQGAAAVLSVTVTNTGTATWRAQSASDIGHVRLGVQLLDADHRLAVRDYHRVALPHAVAPGETVTLSFQCPAPAETGRYVLKLDMVAEGVTWFETAGSAPASVRIEVTAS
jgi:SAM-dependent methyltransferase